MMTRYYRLAGLILEITMPEELFFEKESLLRPFRVEAQTADITFRFEKADQLQAPVGKLIHEQTPFRVYKDMSATVRYLDVFGEDWKDATVRLKTQGNQVHAQLRSARFPGRITERYVLESLGVEHLVAGNDGFVFHCAYVSHNEGAILFTAPSGTGKSTQAELWKTHRGARIVNGDKAVVRLADGRLVAEGLPFSGSSRYCENRSFPITAIVYLEQAPVTSVRRIRGYEAFSRLWEGITVYPWERADLERASDVALKAAEEIPVYHLACTPDESAVIALEEIMRKQVKL